MALCLSNRLSQPADERTNWRKCGGTATGLARAIKGQVMFWLKPLPIDIVEADATTTILRNRMPPPQPGLSKRASTTTFEGMMDDDDHPAGAATNSKTGSRLGLTQTQEYLVLLFGAASLVVLDAYPTVSIALAEPEGWIMGVMGVVLFGHTAVARRVMCIGLALFALCLFLLLALLFGFLPAPRLEMATNAFALVLGSMFGLIMASAGYLAHARDNPVHIIELQIDRTANTATLIDVSPEYGERAREFPLSSVKARIVDIGQKPLIALWSGRLIGFRLPVATEGASQQSATAMLERLNKVLGRGP
jgi:hypothetical protein